MSHLFATSASGHREARGPYFDELQHGQEFVSPAVTLTPGLAAAHQAIVGNRNQLALDTTLSEAVTGHSALAYPALVWDVAIGQSTLATHHVRANLFYRGLAFRHHSAIGDTLSTTTRVVGLRENQRKEGRAATGLATLRITTVDQHDRPVLDFWRCAMLPLSSNAASTTHHDDLSTLGSDPEVTPATPPSLTEWNLEALAPRGRSPELAVSETVAVLGDDVVSSAPELARLTGNVAMIHHDAAAAGGTRLVYGGHTIGLALHQIHRALPGLATVLQWRSCDHLAPVREGDSLRTTIEVTGLTDHGPARVLDLRAVVTATTPAGASSDVLDWRLSVLTL